MRTFFKECLRDLEQFTGIRQLYFLEVDPEGEAKIRVLLDAMVATTRLFPQLSEEDQKIIIRSKMLTDQEYTSLNARVIYKWLNEFKYPAIQKEAEPVKPARELTPEESARIDKMAQQFLATIGTAPTKAYKDLNKDMARIALEDQERQEGRKGSNYKPDPEKVLLAERKQQAIKNRGLDKLDLRDLKKFDVEGQNILARNLEEAQEIYLEVYA
jgi:hypothetical protein